MANSDYQIRGTGSICSRGALGVAVNEGTTIFELNPVLSSMKGPLTVGMGFFVDKEVCIVTQIMGSQFRVARGCADTIPAPHVPGSNVWFFENDVGSDNREYLNGDVIGVKVLMKTSAKVMSIADAPAQELTMVGRFGRPYPPGQVFVGNGPFYTLKRMDLAEPNLVFQWAHRDRITQADQLIGHEQNSYGPEAGTTYLIRVYSSIGTLLRTVDGITGTTYTYTLDDAADDFGGLDEPIAGYFTLASSREGLESMQHYRIDFTAFSSGGWGNNFGARWGY